MHSDVTRLREDFLCFARGFKASNLIGCHLLHNNHVSLQQ